MADASLRPWQRRVFTHADGSIYDDLPEARYHFPQTYLRAVEASLGDWIVYYEPRRIEAGSEKTGGRQAYFATARLRRIEQDFSREGHFYGIVSDYVAFPYAVPFRERGAYYESLLQRSDGKTSKGAFGRSVRNIPDREIEAIFAAGFAGVRDDLGTEDWEAEDHLAQAAPGFAEPALPFVRPILERLARKPFGEAAFARQVKTAYGARCAMTGLRILNGGGRPEVQAAHIRPVAEGGPDTVRNGIALCGTAHWMFDRGLVSVDDAYSILVAKDHADYLFHHRMRFKG